MWSAVRSLVSGNARPLVVAGQSALSSLLVVASLALLIGCPGASAPPSSAGMPPPLSPTPEFVHLLDGCEIRTLDGELLKVLAGHLCAIFESGVVVSAVGDGLMAHDRVGRILWRLPIAAHHDMNITDQGTLVLVSREERPRLDPATGRQIIDHSIHHVGGDGRVLFEWKTSDHLAALRELHPPHPMLDELPPLIAERYSMISPRPALLFHEVGRLTGAMPEHLVASWDAATGAHFLPATEPEQQLSQPRPTPLGYYHLNSVQMLGDNVLAARDPAFRAGNFLVSFCNFGFVAIIDQDTGAIAWSRTIGDNTPGQHAPRLHADGGMTMLINNEDCDDGFCSSVVEIDPLSGRELFRWQGSPPESFHSLITGWVEKQPSGNYLVSWSKGAGSFEAFEVTPAGEVTWSWSRPSGMHEGEILKFFFSISRVPYARVAGAVEGAW